MQFHFGSQRISVNTATRSGLETAVSARFRAGQGFALATVNLDHLVKMRTSRRFLQAYQEQDLIVADGNPIVWLSRIAGRPVELMPGSDLVAPLCRLAAESGVPVALVGSTDGALQDARRALSDKVTGLEFCLLRAPSAGFDPDGEEADRILEALAKAGPCLCLLALGAPKQEYFASRGREAAPQAGFASIGAGLDFLGGHQKRAPRWVQALAMEWLWRALTSPARLGPRYARCAAILPSQLHRAWKLRGAGPAA